MRRIALAFVVLSLIASAGLAKGTEDCWDNLKTLQPGQKIEVVEVALRSHQGNFVSFSNGDITLRRAGGVEQVVVERNYVMRVPVSDGSKRTRNLLIFAELGAAAGIGGGLLIDEGVRHMSGGGDYVYTPLLGAAGAALGAWAGSRPAHRTVYRAPDHRVGDILPKTK